MDSGSVKKSAKDLFIAWRYAVEVIRWTSVVVFTVLFLTGLILRLPWKILLLIVIIPIVGLVVPRKMQKWVWALLTLVGIGVYVWIFYLPEKAERGWKTYQFSGPADPAFPADEQNAALRYDRFVDAYGDVVFSYPYSPEEDQATYGGPWKTEQFEGLSRWLDDREPALETLMDIAKMPVCRFEAPIDLERYERQQFRIQVLKAWASVLIRSAHRDLGAGRPEAALEKELACLGMARQLFTQGTLLDQATGYNLEQKTGRVLKEFVIEHADQETMLEEIETAMKEVDSGWKENWPLILQGEKVLAMNYAAMFYQVNADGQTRISRDLGQGLHDVLEYPAYRFFRSSEFSRLLVLSMWLSMPSSPKGVGAMIESRFDRYSRMAEEGKDLEYVDTWPVWLRGLNCKSIVDWYAKQQVSFYYPLQRKDLGHAALGRVMQVLIEMKRHRLREGTWPERLDDLLNNHFTGGRLFDPISELPFLYQRTGDGFRLYGTGPNQHDDGGVQNEEGKDDWLYWPLPGDEHLGGEDAEDRE